jgi:Tol biopolymer transport system component
MRPGVARTAAFAALALLFSAGCKGVVNDDVNFFVLTFRSSTDGANAQANGPSSRPVFTPDGRYLVFESRATNLVAADTNNRADIYRKDMATGEVILVSVDSTGAQANGNSSNPVVTPDGNFIAFQTDATNLVGNDANLKLDIYVRDLGSQTTVRASVRTNGTEGAQDCVNPSISDDGRFVAFETSSFLVGTDTNIFVDVYVRDLSTNETTRVSVDSSGTDPNAACVNASISGDGQLVTYESEASDIVTNDVGGFSDIFAVVWRAPIPFNERISVEDPSNPDGLNDGVNANGDSIRPRTTSDGRFVVFLSTADDLVVGDSNTPVVDVFVRDRFLGTTVRASVSSQGGETTRSCTEASISADGRWVIFSSEAPDLVQSDTNSTSDIFLRDLVQLTTIRVSVATYGVQSSDFFPNATGTVSGDGRFVAFASAAPNLAPNDTNGVLDIFVRGPLY